MTRGRALFLAACIGCGGEPAPVARLTPPAASTAPVAEAPGPIGAPRPAPRALPPPLPAWLYPDFDERSPPLRAKLARAPEVFGDERNLALNTPASQSKVATIFPVLEEPRPESERIRVLCTSYRDRVALFVKRGDLALVTRKGAVLVARDDELDAALTAPETFASFVFNAGVDLGFTSDPTSKIVPVTYGQHGVRFSGVMFRSQLDQVYEWPVDAGTFRRNAKITGAAVLHDAWRGKAFAQLEAQEAGSFHDVETRGPARQGMQLVRVRLRDGLLTGWVDEAKVQRAPQGAPPRVTMGRGGGWSGSRAIDLPKGTLLLLGGEPIGVVTANARYGCVADCSDRTPTVSVSACHASLDLVAQRPQGSEN